jgi:hypothetical protein
VVLAGVVIAGGYLRVARARGVDARVLPYVLTVVGLVGLGFAFAAVWARTGLRAYPGEPSTLARVLFRFRGLG